MGRRERGNRVVAGVGFSPAVRLRVGARDVGSVHLAAPLSRPSSKPGPRTLPSLKTRVLGPGSGGLCGRGNKDSPPDSRGPTPQLHSDKPRDLLQRSCFGSRWRRFVGCSYAGRERGACQVQSAASRRLASPRTGRWCGRRDRVRAWPSRRARAGNFASPVMRFAAARSPGNFASPVMRFAAARSRCFVRPDRPVTPSSGQFTRQNEDIARPRRRHWLPAGVGKRVAGERTTAEIGRRTTRSRAGSGVGVMRREREREREREQDKGVRRL